MDPLFLLIGLLFVGVALRTRRGVLRDVRDATADAAMANYAGDRETAQFAASFARTLLFAWAACLGLGFALVVLAFLLP